jgi:hypothetical protein
MLGGGVGVGAGGSVGYAVDNGSEDAGKPLLSSNWRRPLRDRRRKRMLESRGDYKVGGCPGATRVCVRDSFS